MAINYPTSLDTLTPKVDNVDDVMAVDMNDVQDICEALEAKVGVDSSAVTSSIDYKVNNFLINPRVVYLYENTAPTGWSIVAVTDKVLALKGGAQAYNVSGGTTAGTWTHNHGNGSLTYPNHSHSNGSLQIAAHNHQWYVHNYAAVDRTFASNGAETDVVSTDVATSHAKIVVNSQAGDDSIQDAYTDNQAAANVTGSTATDGGGNVGGSTANVSTWRPDAAVGILVLKAV